MSEAPYHWLLDWPRSLRKGNNNMNSAEMQNREIKASKMARACFEAGITVDELVICNEENWKTIASHANCKPPNSQETKDRVSALLEKAYADAAAEADDKTEGEWLDAQMDESGADRCPPRE